MAIGSDIYLVIDPRARRALVKNQTPSYRVLHGSFHAENGTFPLGEAVFGFAKAASLDKNYLLRGEATHAALVYLTNSIPRLSQRTELAVVATTSSMVAIARPCPNLLCCFVTGKYAGILELATFGDGRTGMLGVHGQ